MSEKQPALPPPPAPFDVVVVGAGAAGLMAATAAAERGRRTLLLEKNRKPGVKILMSGGTRCNITHATDNRGIVAAFGTQGKFLHSALAAFGVEATVNLFVDEGVPVKTEETGKIFPVSDRAADVLAALLRRLGRTDCTLAFDEPLVEVLPVDDGFELITSHRRIAAERLIITTGGQSYPRCGTTGDGYRWAAELGHTIVAPRPALVPIVVEIDWVRNLRGITLKDVGVRVLAEPGGGKPSSLAERRSSLLFTHFGLSGPAALDVSRSLTTTNGPAPPRLEIDLLPAVRRARLEESLSHAGAGDGGRPVSAKLGEFLPARLLAALLTECKIPTDRRCAELGRHERARLIDGLKAWNLPVAGTLGFDKAEVTAGGVDLAEIDSRTLQSKRTRNLYFAGEVLDLDGPIGGYNFQAAWSTGFLAGCSAAG